jgi:hypothetical protein
MANACIARLFCLFFDTRILLITKFCLMKRNGIWLSGAVALSIALVSLQIPEGVRTEHTENIQTTWGKIGQGSVQPNQNGVGTVSAVPGKPVRSIKIKVITGGVNIHKCEIWFSDGTRKEVEMRNDVPAGSESREISVGESLKHISKVVLWYDTRSYNKSADVELWGKKLS